MSKFISIAVAVLALCVFGCGSDDSKSSKTPTEAKTTPASTEETTVTIGDTEYTCAEALDVNNCAAKFQSAFDKWGKNINEFVEYRIVTDAVSELRDQSALGIAACAIAVDGGNEDDFISYSQKYYDLDNDTLISLWDIAGKSMCPDVIDEVIRDKNPNL